jgi:hypothetical protein
MVVLFLYPTWQQYREGQRLALESQQRADELKTLREHVNYELVKQPDNDSRHKVFTAKESETGVSVSFEWLQPDPPDQMDFDEVFAVALGVDRDIENEHGNADKRGFTVIDARGLSKLSKNESILARRLQRLGDQFDQHFHFHKIWVRLHDRLAERSLYSPESERPTPAYVNFFGQLCVTVFVPLVVLVLALFLKWVFSAFALKKSE